MKFKKDPDGPSLEALVALLEHSHIVAVEPDEPAARFPAGFDDVDIAILEWLAAERRLVASSSCSLAAVPSLRRASSRVSRFAAEHRPVHSRTSLKA
jgi:hypothetical protein